MKLDPDDVEHELFWTVCRLGWKEFKFGIMADVAVKALEMVGIGTPGGAMLWAIYDLRRGE